MDGDGDGKYKNGLRALKKQQIPLLDIYFWNFCLC